MDSTIQIRTTLSNLYSSKTTSKLMYYRQDLHSQKKGDLLMKDFLMQIKMFYDQLTSCGEVISEPEHVTAILNGIPPEYELIFTINLVVSLLLPTNCLLLDLVLVRTEGVDEADLTLSLNVSSMENFEDKDEDEGFDDLLVKSVRPIVETYNRYNLAVLEHAIFKEVARKTTLEFVAR
ncbi:hypothetical protein Gogos_017991 [Gossypium gossypioides]|uniref:Uncharacterized protein n=1 Tax=Gossypium gossypioides TaxID=34282 RepID=A0A7J9BCQ3_GOSGO|nr:hypothetical protein [Gossypium gossypioides]